MRYLYCNDFPLSLAAGGKENQLRFVSNVARSVYDEVDDISSVAEVSSGDVLHCFGDSPYFLHLYKLLQGQGKDVKLIINPNFYRRSPYLYWVPRALSWAGPNWWSERYEMYRMAEHIVVNSWHEHSYLKTIFGSDISSKIIVIPNTFDLATDLVGKLPLGLPEKYICCVSHLNERKNIFNLLRAAIDIHREFSVPLVLVGGQRFSNFKNNDKFEKLLSSAGDAVIWLNAVEKSEAMAIIKQAEVHVLPSFVESPGLSNLEAVMLGTKVIVGDFPIVREYLGSSAVYTGFSSRAIENSVKMALTQSPSLIGEKALSIPDWWKPESVEKAYTKLFKELL